MATVAPEEDPGNPGAFEQEPTLGQRHESIGHSVYENRQPSPSATDDLTGRRQHETASAASQKERFGRYSLLDNEKGAMARTAARLGEAFAVDINATSQGPTQR